MRIVLIISNLLSFDNRDLVSGHQRGGSKRYVTFALTFASAGLPGLQ